MRAITGLVLGLMLAAPTLGQQQSETPWQDVVTAQIEALRLGDGAAALALAGKPFQDTYSDPGKFFSDIVAAGYAPIVQSVSHSFGVFRQIGPDHVAQEVRFFGADDVLFEAVYDMVEEPGRGWTVHGVVLRRAAAIGA